MYDNWKSSLEYPNIEQQVKDDLAQYFNPSQEVMDRLTGESSDQKVVEILNDYGQYIRNKFISEIASKISEVAGQSFGEMLEPMMKKWLQAINSPAQRWPIPGMMGSNIMSAIGRGVKKI